jgi:hypothetical protein
MKDAVQKAGRTWEEIEEELWEDTRYILRLSCEMTHISLKSPRKLKKTCSVIDGVYVV